MLFAKIILAVCIFVMLRQILTGKGRGGSSLRIVKLRLSERPGAWYLGPGQFWYTRDEWPSAWWGNLIVGCLISVGCLLVIFGVITRPPSDAVMSNLFFGGFGGLAMIGIVWNLCRLLWQPSRSDRKILGIGSARTVTMYAAAALSAAVTTLLNLGSDFRLWYLFWIPLGFLSLARTSIQIDTGQPTLRDWFGPR